VSRFPLGDDSKKSKKNEGNGKDEEQMQGSFTALRMTTKNKGNTVALDQNHPGCGGGLRILVKDGTEVGG
jgi:hypothetical protein